MPSLLRMPEVAAGTTEAVLSSWTVPVEGAFEAGEPIAVIETAKAAVDLEAPRDGTLLATLVQEGAGAEVGTPIALLGAPGERVPDIPAALATLGVDPPLSMSHPHRSTVVDVTSTTEGEESAPPVTRVFASPLARRLAREAGVAIEGVTGSGPNGRVTGRDIRAAVAARPAPAPDVAQPAPDAVAARPAPAPDVAQPAPDAVAARPGSTDTPHTRLRRTIADRLTQSKQAAPHFYLRGSVRAGALLKLRSQINEASEVRVSLNDLIVKAVAHAHLGVPEMNVIWTPDAIRSFTAADVAIAVATDAGLLAPVVRNADAASVTTIARLSSDLADRARRGALKQHELEGGTITVTNLGMHGTEDFTAIINPPQAAILAVGAVRQEPVVDDDGTVIAAPLMRLTLSVDHRPVDGVTAARWMRTLIEILQQPLKILV